MVDIGTSKVGAALSSKDGEPLGLAYLPLPGWPERPPSFQDLSSAVTECMKEAASMAGQVNVRRVWAALNGAAIRYEIRRGTVMNRDSQGLVTAEELARAAGARELRNMILRPLLISTTLDGVEVLENPIGMTGHRLEVHILHLGADTPRAAEIKRAVEESGYVCQGFVAGPLAAASVLTAAEKEIGTAVLELGASHSTAAVFLRGEPRHLASIPLGGGHLTRDLAVATGLPLGKAEDAKIEAFSRATGGGLAAPDAYERVFTARLAEIFELIKSEIKGAGWSNRIPGGYVLTGGGSLPQGLRAFAERALCAPVRIGLPDIGRAGGMTAGPAFAVLLGMAQTVRHISEGSTALGQKEVGTWRSKLLRRNSQA